MAFNLSSLVDKAKQAYYQNQYDVQKAYESMLSKLGVVTEADKAKILAALETENKQALAGNVERSKRRTKTIAIVTVSALAVIGIVVYIKKRRK